MRTAACWEPYESRDSRTVLGARGGESPPRDSTDRLRGGSPAANLAGIYEVLQRGSHSSVSGQGCSNPSSDPAVRWDHICSDTRWPPSSVLQDLVIGKDNRDRPSR